MARAADMAYETIQNAIVTGEYAPGSWLREEDLAERAGVSRTPVREALRQLNIEGFVEIVPNRGALVLGWTAQDLDDIHDLRALLEGYAVRRAAEDPGTDLAALGELCAEMERLLEEHGDAQFPRIGELSSEFHTAIYQSSGNRQLIAVMPSLIQIPLAREGYHQRTREAIVRSLAQHREILDALSAHDADWAESAMRAHIRAGRTSLRRQGRWAEDGAGQEQPAADASIEAGEV
jgi:DNA-binding GntR family transcriptional regulator